MTVKVEFSINTVELEVKYLYNHLIVLMDRVDFTRAFGDLRITIEFLGAR